LRVIPDRIATRMAAAIVLSLVATQVINGVVYFALLGSSDPEFAGHVLLERFAAIARIIDRAAPEERPHFVAVAAQPPMELALGTEPPKREPTHSRQLDHARQEIQRALEDPDRNVLIFKGTTDNSEGGSAWVELSNGGWLSVTVADLPVAGPGRLALRLALVAIVVAPISFWAARKLSAPLAAFAEAAEKLGIDSAAPPLREQGPRELNAGAAQALHRRPHAHAGGDVARFAHAADTAAPARRVRRGSRSAKEDAGRARRDDGDDRWDPRLRTRGREARRRASPRSR
jgi:hypothetical protein